MPETLRGLVAWVDGERLAGTAVSLALLFIGARLLRAAAARHLDDAAVRYRVRKAVAFLAAVLAVPIVLAGLSGRVANLALWFGVASAAAAFALQEVLLSAAGWIAIVSGRYYAPGDRIHVGGVTGDVIDLGVLRTTLMECGAWVDGDLYNGRIVRIPNSLALKGPVVNYSADFPFLWDELKVRVTHGSDLELARSLLIGIVEPLTRETVAEGRRTWAEMVRRYRIEDARIEPMVHLAVTDNWVEFTVRYVVDYRRRRAMRDAIHTQALGAIRATGGKVALASATIDIVGLPPVRLGPPAVGQERAS